MQTPLRLSFRWLIALSVGLASVWAAPTARAADNTWTNTGGDFAWNTTASNWTTPAIWNNNPLIADAAIFGATGVGTVNVSSGIIARSMNFTADAYTLTGGNITFVPTGTGTLGALTIAGAAATTTTINSNLLGSNGLIFNGNAATVGNFVLGGSNIITGSVPLGTSSLAVNVLIGNATTQNAGGTVTLSSGTAFGTNTTFGIGNGVLDIGANNITVAGLTFANTTSSASVNIATPRLAGTGTVTLAGDINVIGNATGFGNVINTPIELGATTRTFAIGSGSNLERELVVNSVISGTGGLFKTSGVGTTGLPSAGGFTLAGNNTYTGPTVISGNTSNFVFGTNASTSLTIANATVSLRGANGSFGSATAVNLLPGGVLSLDNNSTIASAGITGPSVLNTGRLASTATVTMNGGTLVMNGLSTTPSIQGFGSLTVGSGFNIVTLAANGTGGTAELNVTGGLTIQPGASILFRGATLPTTAGPTASNRVAFGTAPATTGGVIVGAIGANSATGTGTDFVRYDPTFGIVRLATGDYSSFGAGGNVTNAATTTVTTQTLNSLRLTASQTLTIAAGNTLTNTTGMILNSSGTAPTITGGTLAFGAAPAMFFTAGSNLTVNSAITGTGGLVKASAGNTLTLGGDLSGLSGTIVVQNGTLALNTVPANAITVLAGTVNFNAATGAGGTLTIGSPANLTGVFALSATANINNAAITNFSRNIVVAGTAAPGSPATPFGQLTLTPLSGTQTISGNVTLNNNLSINPASGTTTLSGQVTGTGGFRMSGSGTLIVTNTSNNFTGAASVSAGILAAAGNNTLGTGTLEFAGGTLRIDSPTTSLGNTSARVLVNSTLNTNGNNFTLPAIISGTGTLTKSGAGTLTLTGNSPNYSGTLALTAGNLTLSGAGALTGAAGVNVNNGQLLLDNSAGNVTRVGTGTLVTVAGGEFRVNGNSAGTTVDLGSFTFGIGANTLTLAPATGASLTLNIGNFTSGGSSLFRGTGLSGTGANTSRIFLANVTPGLLAGSLFDNTLTGTGSALAAYDLATGVRAAVPADFYGVAQSPTRVIQNTASISTPTTANVRIDTNWTTGQAGESNSINSLVFAPASTLTVSNTLTATSGGVFLEAGAASTLTGGTVAFGTAAANFFGNGSLSVASTLTGTGGVTKSGTGTVTLTAPYSLTGPVTVNGGTLSTSGDVVATALGGAGGTLNLNGAALTVNTAANSTFNGAVTNATNFVKTGTGNQTLGGSLGVSGNVEVRSGPLTLGAANVLSAASTLVIGDPVAGNTAVFDLNGNNQTVGGLTFIAKTSGGAAAQLTGVGTLTVNGPISFVNQTTTPNNAFPVTVSNTVTAIDLGGAVRTLTVQANNNTSDVTFNAPITNGGLDYTGTPTGATPARITLGAVNTFTGGLTIQSGTVIVVSGATAGAANSPVVVNSSTNPSLFTVSGNLAIGSLSGTVTGSTATITNGTAGNVLTINQSTAGTFGGIFTGAGGITKAGTATLTISGTNTLTGPAVVNAGVLSVTGSTAAGSAVSVNAGGTLAGTGTVNGTVAVNAGTGTAGGRIRGDVPGSTTGALAVNNNVTVNAAAGTDGGRLLLEATTATNTTLNVTGTGVLNFAGVSATNAFGIEVLAPTLPLGTPVTKTIATAAGGIQRNGTAVGAAFTFATTDYFLTSPNFLFTAFSLVTTDPNTLQLTFTPTPVPEPGTVLLIAGLGAGLVGYVRRRNRRPETTVAA